MSPRRAASGGLIDRSRDIRFSFDGKSFTGHPGDTLASALLANGVLLAGRSFKYHRPRGLIAAGLDEPNALVTLLDGDIREPNIPATMVRIREGLDAISQNNFPSLGFDLGAVNGLAGPIFAAGFYYKTFMGPVIGPLKGTRVWHFFEWFIRRAAGLGSASPICDTAKYGRMNAFCDMLVTGSGPSGLNAALDAARSGKRVILAEAEAELGGSARWTHGLPEAEAILAELALLPNVTLLPRTMVWGAYDGGTWAAVEEAASGNPSTPRQRHWVIRAAEMIMAAGAYERPLVFPGNDAPGIMLASAAQRYACEFAVLPGKASVVFTNNDSAYAAAAALKKAGGSISHIIDLRPSPGETARELAYEAGAELLAGHCVTGAHGGKALASVSISPCNESGMPQCAAQVISAGSLLMSGGWSPAIQLAAQTGGRPQWSESLQAFLPPQGAAYIRAVGAAAGDLDFGAGLSPEPSATIEIRAKGKAFVDFQHDVTADDVRLAHREGFSAPEHMKRYTTLGMATDQGRTSGVNGVAILAAERGLGVGETGVTRFRPPFAPVSLGAISAERYGDLKPHRDTPMQAEHKDAQTYQAGLWTRPSVYPLAGETVEQAYVREAAAVRASAGIVDVSTLGKIAVQGPDAAEFLDRVYTNLFSTLPVGKARYGLMLREDGFVMDDGTTWRLGQNDFLMTTTTANAGKVMQHLEYFLECVWPELRVIVTSVTDEWAGASIAGPKARDILAACVTGADVSNAQLPFMGIVKGEVAGAPVLICRLSFSGELAYEVYSGAGHGAHVWRALVKAGEPFGMVRYGLEALGALRIEKGHVTGAEIDGRTTARDLHLDWMLSKKKPFIGSAMMDREGMTGPQRITLVGLVSADGGKFSGGAHLVEHREEAGLGESLGHVTAMCFSPALGTYIGLALLRDGKARIGERLYTADPLRGQSAGVNVVSHHMFDPDGSRMHG